MNVNEIREKSRSVIGPYCKSCPVCNVVSHVQYVMEKLVLIKYLDLGLKEQGQ